VVAIVAVHQGPRHVTDGPTGERRDDCVTERADLRAADRRGGAREAIVEAAIDCFFERGYDGTSVQDVVERAGVTKGAFYHHFTKKEDLLLHIHDRFMDQQMQALEAGTAGDLPPREALTLLIEEIVVSAAEFQREYVIFFEQRRNLSGEPFEKVRAKRDEYERRVVQTIEDGIARGDLRDVPSAQVLAFGIIGMAAWSYHWYRPSGMTPREIGRMYASVVLDGVVRRS
jgi:AcrR family transcriptional regulator